MEDRARLEAEADVPAEADVEGEIVRQDEPVLVDADAAQHLQLAERVEEQSRLDLHLEQVWGDQEPEPALELEGVDDGHLARELEQDARLDLHLPDLKVAVLVAQELAGLGVDEEAVDGFRLE